jgi:hypothetical protein
MLSKTISTSRKVNRLPDRAALLYTWLIPHTDDFGHLEGDAMSIKAKVSPMRSITEQEVLQDLELMVQNELIRTYEVRGEKYIEISNFDTFQTFRTDRKRKAEYPGPDGTLPVDTQRYTTDIPEGDIAPRKGREEKGREGKVREGKPTASVEYLSKIPSSDMKEFLDRFVADEKKIRSKAEDLRLYCERKNKRYSNYKSFLLNALKKDFKERDGATAAGGKFQGL